MSHSLGCLRGMSNPSTLLFDTHSLDAGEYCARGREKTRENQFVQLNAPQPAASTCLNESPRRPFFQSLSLDNRTVHQSDPEKRTRRHNRYSSRKRYLRAITRELEFISDTFSRENYGPMKLTFFSMNFLERNSRDLECINISGICTRRNSESSTHGPNVTNG